MGSALTYARRYALFTLVGIAGEDDLDAPDLNSKPYPQNGPLAPAFKATRSSGGDQKHLDEHNRQASGAHNRSHDKKGSITPATMPSEQSAILRDRLVSEVAAIDSIDAAARWAKESLRTKNMLTPEDAGVVEQTFEKAFIRLGPQFVSDHLEGAEATSSGVWRGESTVVESENLTATDSATNVKGLDKSLLTISTTRRYRNRPHLRFVAAQACLVCGRVPCDAHHLRFAQPRALGRKVSDEFAVPLCRTHHRAAHRVGDEATWWMATGIDPLKVARELWSQTRDPAGKPQ
jgi:hypothetical protein